jgi:hypothetical protein
MSAHILLRTGAKTPMRRDLAMKNEANTWQDSTSLDHQETKGYDPEKVESPYPADSDVSFRHSGWSGTRHHITEAFTALAIPVSRRMRFDGCGSNAWVMRNKQNPQTLRIAASYCHDRWCVPCARTRSSLIVKNLNDRLKGRVCRLVTLTIRHTDRSLKECIDHLLLAFRNLRHQKIWLDSVDGGASFLEIKRAANTRRWHPHLHILCTGKYVDQKKLSAAWSAASGGSTIVDIRLCHSNTHAGSYVTKYITKPASKELIDDPSSLQNLIMAMSGRRVCNTFGDWRGWKLGETCPGDDDDWQVLGTLNKILLDAHRCVPGAQEILDQLHRRNSPWHDLTNQLFPP